MNTIPIAEVLKKSYSLDNCKIQPNTSGSGINFWINDKYLLKIFSNSIKYRLEDEINVCKYLHNNGFITSEHVLSNSGHYVQNIGEYRCHLQKKIQGISHEKNTLSYIECILLLKKLQQIIELLLAYPFETEVNSLFSHEYVKSEILHAISLRCCNSYSGLISILNRKKQLINRIKFKTGIVQHTVLSHSDFNIQQVLTTGSKLITLDDIIVIDFSHVSKIPVEWELIKTCLRSMHFDQESCVQAILYALETFNSVIPITFNNIAISMIQLISSTYMEKLYLETHNPNWINLMNYDLNVLEAVYNRLI